MILKHCDIVPVFEFSCPTLHFEDPKIYLVLKKNASNVLKWDFLRDFEKLWFRSNVWIFVPKIANCTFENPKIYFFLKMNACNVLKWDFFYWFWNTVISFQCLHFLAKNGQIALSKIRKSISFWSCKMRLFDWFWNSSFLKKVVVQCSSILKFLWMYLYILQP